MPRLAATRAITDRLKSAAAWAGLDALLAVLDDVPRGAPAPGRAAAPVGRLANVVATNVPGAARDALAVRLAGRWSGAPIVPIVDGIGLGLAVFSYDGCLQVGLNADAGPRAGPREARAGDPRGGVRVAARQRAAGLLT